jgi:ubiquinol-cytochrome c reductase cytochrome c subunit
VKTLSVRRRHKAATPVLVLFALALIGALYAALGAATGAQAAGDLGAQAAKNAQITAGHKLFVEGCSSCHGVGAQGGPSAPTLVGVGAAAVDFQVATGRMPLAAGQAQAPEKPVIYTDEEIKQMAAFIGSLAPGPAIPTAEDTNYEGANLAMGGTLFRTNCTQCHNFAGSGGALSRGAYAPAITDSSPEIIYEAMLTGPENMPVFSDQTLTPKDKQDIIKYIEYIKVEPSYGGYSLGALGPVTEGLMVWLGVIGVLIAMAVWIGAKVR